jgi:hypothetical protein
LQQFHDDAGALVGGGPEVHDFDDVRVPNVAHDFGLQTSAIGELSEVSVLKLEREAAPERRVFDYPNLTHASAAEKSHWTVGALHQERFNDFGRAARRFSRFHESRVGSLMGLSWVYSSSFYGSVNSARLLPEIERARTENPSD